MQTFEFFLKNEKIKTYNLLSWFIIVIHVIIFSYLAISSDYKTVGAGYLAGLIILTAAFLLRYYLEKKKTRWQIKINNFYFLMMIIWIANEQYWVAAILLFL